MRYNNWKLREVLVYFVTVSLPPPLNEYIALWYIIWNETIFLMFFQYNNLPVLGLLNMKLQKKKSKYCEVDTVLYKNIMKCVTSKYKYFLKATTNPYKPVIHFTKSVISLSKLYRTLRDFKQWNHLTGLYIRSFKNCFLFLHLQSKFKKKR